MMDAVKFLDKVDRLSKRGSTEEKMRYNAYRTAGDNTWAVKFVERWAVAHPVKTRQSVFLEQYPETKILEDGAIVICPLSVSAAYREKREKDGSCASLRFGECDKCRKAFWLDEVEE